MSGLPPPPYNPQPYGGQSAYNAPYPAGYPQQNAGGAPGYGYPPQPQPNYGGGGGWTGYGQPPVQQQPQPQVVYVERERDRRENNSNCCLYALLACCAGCCLAECCD